MDDRTITPEEVDVVRWLLAHASMIDVSRYRAEQLANARVVPSCTCGCASIDFVLEEGSDGVATGTAGLHSTAILAEAFTRWPDGAQAGVMLWGTEGKLLGIELYDLGSDASRRFPTIDVLRRWEDYYDVHPGG